MKIIMTPNTLEVTLMFTRSKIMPCMLPKSKEVMIQSSWNKTAAKIRPQSKLPFLRIMKAKIYTLPSFCFPFSPPHSLHSLSKSPSSWLLWKWTVMMTSNKQKSGPSPSTLAGIIYTSGSALHAHSLHKKESLRIFPEFSSFISLLEKNERLSWVLQPH